MRKGIYSFSQILPTLEVKTEDKHDINNQNERLNSSKPKTDIKYDKSTLDLQEEQVDANTAQKI